MSVTMARTDGVTVLTLTTDPESPCPPLCQILGHLCYNPLCCTVSQRYKSVQEDPLIALGALQIMVGVLSFGLGFILCYIDGALWWQINGGWFPLWFSVLFMLCGIMCIRAERRPSPCLVFSSVILNLVGAVFAIAAIVLYSINIPMIWLWWMCDDDLPLDDPVHKKCLEGGDLLLILMRCVNSTLIVLSVLELCVSISAAVLVIKTMKKSNRREI